MRGRIALQKHFMRHRQEICALFRESFGSAHASSRQFQCIAATSMLFLKQGSGPLFSFLTKKSSHGALLCRGFERVNKISKPLGENFRAKIPVLSHPGRSNVMPKQSVPAFPKLLVHRSVHIMKVNCLERFQELIGGMKKTRPLFDGKRADIFQTYPPYSFQFSVLH